MKFAAILFLIFPLIPLSASTVNHTKCACERKDGDVIADCRGLDYTEVPQLDLRCQMDILYLQYNHISILRSERFAMYGSLKELHMHGNGMTSIAENAFDGLRRLRKLDLSRNRLYTVPGNAFAKLKTNLRWLSLSMNSLQRIPAGIGNLTRLEYLDLSSNYFIRNIHLGNLPSSLVQLDISKVGVKFFKREAFGRLSSLRTLIMSDIASGSTRFEKDVFDGLISLEYLDMSRTYSRKLPPDSFTRMTKLGTLLLNNCRLTNLPIWTKNNVGMHSDDVSENMLTGLSTLDRQTDDGRMNASSTSTESIWFNPELTRLDLSNNRQLTIGTHSRFPPSLIDLRFGFTIIPALIDEMFSTNTKLQKLDLCRTKLESISRNAFMQLSNVSEICLSGNPFATAPRFPASLVHLNMTNTKVVNLSRGIFDELRNVVEANLGSSDIVRIADYVFSNMTSLLKIDLSGNKIETLKRDSLHVGRIETMYAGDGRLINPRTSQDSSEMKSKDAMSAVEHINLSNNLLQAIEPGAFSTHGNLRRIDLRTNSLQTLYPGIFSGLKNLITLQIDYNEIMDVLPRSLDDMQNLEALNMSNNNIEIIYAGTFDRMTKLSWLDLSNNRIIKVHTLMSDSIQYLDISFNNLTTFPMIRGRNLLKVVTSFNPIEQLHHNALSNTPNLQNLDLSRCNIAGINYGIFSTIPNLRHLDLSGNYISEFLDVKMPNLETFNLAENEISAVDQSLRRVAPAIQSLDLAYNHISYLDPRIFNGTETLHSLDLIGNNFECDCALLPLVEWIEDNFDSGLVDIRDGEMYLCEGPPEEYAVPILASVAELHCDPPHPTQPSSSNTYAGVVVGTCLAAIGFVLLSAACFKKSRRSENEDPLRHPSPGVAIAHRGCCYPCKQWWFSVAKFKQKADSSRVDRTLPEERQDLMIPSPVTSPTESNAAEIL